MVLFYSDRSLLLILTPFLIYFCIIAIFLEHCTVFLSYFNFRVRVGEHFIQVWDKLIKINFTEAWYSNSSYSCYWIVHPHSWFQLFYLQSFHIWLYFSPSLQNHSPKKLLELISVSLLEICFFSIAPIQLDLSLYTS